jgi:putative endonuclease
MHHTYILFSKSKNKYYIGSTSNIQDRIIKHNSNHKGFTGKMNDWEIVYLEEFDSIQKARFREKQIKNWKSRIMIENLINKV